jgi:hypothetical protein
LLDQKDYATANAQSADKDFKVTVVRYLLQASVTSPIQSAATVQGKLTPAQYSGNGLKVLSRIAQGAPVQFSVPALNQTIPRVCSEYLIDVSVPTNTASVTTLANGDVVTVGPNTSAAANVRSWTKYRAAADDADFNGFVSIMPMYVNFVDPA